LGKRATEVFNISGHSFWDDLGGFHRHPDLVTRLARIGVEDGIATEPNKYDEIDFVSSRSVD
jgi:hypothetical protein